MNKIIRPYLNNLKIKFLGRKPQQSLRKFYINSSIFIINSIEDGFAMVQAQAMACGLPIISTTNSGGEDIIDNNKNGFICNIRDVEQLKEKIEFFYENKKEYAKFCISAKNKSKSFFSWENYGRKIIKKYKLIREMHR
jgi:glycosyltransferase involved in cell wall biosynthesis